MNRALFFSPFLFACIAAPAQAQTIPRYNAEGYCQQVADISGGSAMIFNGCMDMEQQAYNALKPVWAQLPGNARNYCDEVARVSGGSYTILQGCIEMETEAASSPRSFDY
ncbi:hypothetical protein [Sinisalibacter aestuarii]|uniref:hypothetical protein n=1 Tax=Sinisalibacter aestuarii TaxID=2949426 RepID=UPI002493A453|nr:hypothetical protein [Sinisalibacter aestuarii]